MSLLNPSDTLERQNEKLMQIAQSLMRRVEQKTEQSGLAYQQFERAALLESEVRERTQDLERALDLLQESNARLENANSETEKARTNLTAAIETINEGFALFEREDGLVLSNSRFCRDFSDIEGKLVAGLQFADYVKLLSHSHFLALPKDETPAAWAEQRMNKYGKDHVVFNVRLKWDRWLQVSEHRTSRGGTVILQTDVTTIIRRERRERDKMRDAQAEILQATLDHLNQGVCIFDNSQSLVGWNSRMHGLFSSSPGQATEGMNFNLLLDWLQRELVFLGDIDASYLRDWARRPNMRKPIAFEVNRGPSQILSVFAQEMPDQGFVISFTDVTAERAAAKTLSDMNELLERRVQDRTHELGLALAEAERANASKSRFVAAASHDLLQPLSAAKLFVSSLAEQIQTDEGLGVIEKTETSLKSVEQFISALLDISKLDAGKAIFDVQPLKLSQIFRPLHDELGPLADQKGIELRVVDTDLSIVSDPGYMRRIVQNLLSNAIRYTDAGRVLMGVRRHGNHARIEIWDTGRGIDPKDQIKIFKEFERIAPTHSDTGLGLGLSIVERACKELEHSLKVTSERGRGSCFSVTVPIEDVLNVQSEHHVLFDQEQTQPLRDKLMVLVAHDPQLQAEISSILDPLGANLINVNTSHDAISILEETELVPDMFLFQPKPNLTQTLDNIKKKFGPIPIAMITAKAVSGSDTGLSDLGIPILTHPQNPEQFVQQMIEIQHHPVTQN